MMAARAGAAQVYTCEMKPAIADAAKEIVERNGFSDRIQVLAKHSGKLDAEADLGGRVDVIVSEIVSSDLLGEDVLATMGHAVEKLLKPGGRVIPAKGSIRVALAFDAEASIRRMGIVDGFDLSAFNRLGGPSYEVSAKSNRLELMSEPAELFGFDFHTAEPILKERAQLSLAVLGGTINCVAQWIRLEMDEEGFYEDRPDALEFSTWAVVVHPLAQAVTVTSGDVVTVMGSHERDMVRVWAGV
jgi:hypothetical protein